MTSSELDAINAREADLARASDQELGNRAGDLRRQARDGSPLDTLLPDCFALVRETARRALGQRPYDVQMLAGIALHQGKLVEMQTGEGKTLAAVAPVVLNALTGRGVHVLTYNDYLARRDAAWMGPIYERLGLTVACVQEGLSTAERQRAYGCDVTYLTVKEAGFDLLRDGLCFDRGQQVHRPFHLGLVDEADSILIDEARIPLVIAGTLDETGVDLERLAGIARRLEAGKRLRHGRVRAQHLPDRARRAPRRKAPRLLETFLSARTCGCSPRCATPCTPRPCCGATWITSSATAGSSWSTSSPAASPRTATGPTVCRRRWRPRKDCAAQPEGKILGSITVQHFLRKYPRLCGMTATARPAATGAGPASTTSTVAPIPPHRPCIRVDHPDVIYASTEAKRRALLEEIARTHATGRPILVGTVSVEESEGLAADLRQAGIACRVLNARNDAEEAEIVAEAGALGAVTISTNMAGRGTDIRLGGAGELQREAVMALDGLYIFGTNRHESRRIDDQLRGRAGRQGDPGSSRFILSLEDSLLQRCGIERLLPPKLLQGLRAAGESGEADRAVDHPAVRREVARVQRIVEGQHGDLRARLLTYWQLLEHQRCELQECGRRRLGA